MSESFVDIKSQAVNNFSGNCKTTALDYFNCVEEKIKSVSTLKFNYIEASNTLTKDLIPECQSRFDIKSCFKL